MRKNRVDEEEGKNIEMNGEVETEMSVSREIIRGLRGRKHINPGDGENMKKNVVESCVWNIPSLKMKMWAPGGFG